MNKEYKLSGNNGNVWALTPLVALPLMVLASCIYGYVNVYNPFIYFTAVLWFFFLGAIAVILSFSARISKCRKPGTMTIVGLGVGVLTVYISWAWFVSITITYNDMGIPNPGFINLLLNPGAILTFANFMAEVGLYTIFDTTVKGSLLWTIWIIEAGGILLAGFFGGSNSLHEKVYCEKCNCWAEDLEYDKRLSLADMSEEALNQLISGKVDLFFDCSLAAPGETPQLRLNLNACPNCEDCATLDFDLIQYELNNKDQVVEKSEDMSRVFELSGSQLKRFKAAEFAPPVEIVHDSISVPEIWEE